MRNTRLIWTRYGVYKAPEDGNLIFSWDNKLSIKKDKLIDLYTLLFKGGDGEEIYSDYLKKEKNINETLKKHLQPLEVEGGILYCFVCSVEPTDEGQSYTIHCYWDGNIEGHIEWFVNATFEQWSELLLDLCEHYPKRAAKLPDFPSSVLIANNEIHFQRKTQLNQWLQAVLKDKKLSSSYDLNFLLAYKEHIRLEKRRLLDERDKKKKVEEETTLDESESNVIVVVYFFYIIA